VAVALFFLIRGSTRADYGPAIALCPGPDQYGYLCESGEGYAYLDAATDTLLYEDDGTTQLDLPFPFTFYGTTYTAVTASSNGNLQFGSDNAWFGNECMNGGPVSNMGDMIAPFWDDLDLRFLGFLESETFGVAPDRVFVVEWDDIPRFGDNDDDRVTFEVQLFEKSHDIVFLYEDVTTLGAYNGSSATIGLQSEVQGLALQYGCFQPVVADASGIYFPHPAEPNAQVGMDTVIHKEGETAPLPIAKGHVEELMEMVERWGPTVLDRLSDHWLSLTPQRVSDWRWLDMTGDGHDELLLLWRGDAQHPELSELMIIEYDRAGQTTLLFNERLSTRKAPRANVIIADAADVTHDGVYDVLLADSTSNRLEVVSATPGEPLIHSVPERCSGRLVLLDSDNDGRLEIIRDGCPSNGRIGYVWNGFEFVSTAAFANQK
jgi:hypothetical protein